MPVIWQSRPCHKTTGASPSRGVYPVGGPSTAKGPGCTKTGPPYEIGSSSFSNPPDPAEFGEQLRGKFWEMQWFDSAIGNEPPDNRDCDLWHGS
jgi:hypothetical protein